MTDRFELLEELGAGGMGVVWKARDSETGEIVAVKLVHPHLARDPGYVARFEREVEVARRIDSPNVVRVLGYGTRDGAPFMAMEYVEGDSLKESLQRRGKLGWSEARSIARQVATGLAAVHAAGVIHRDVKPSNILIARDGTAKLADFGIARALDLTRLTGSSTMLGTPHYMPPESNVTAQGDLYSLGCVLYEMLAGRPPYDGETQQEIIAAHIRQDLDVSALPSESRAVVAWLTARVPEQRARTARELVSVLEGSTPAPARIAPKRAPTKKGPILAAAIGGFFGIAVVGGAIVAALVALGGGDEEPPPTATSAPATARPATSTINVPTSTITVRPTSIPTTAPQPTVPSTSIFRPGLPVAVINVGDCLNLRPFPGLGQPKVICLIEGTPATILEGPIDLDGFRWWKLVVPSYEGKAWEGWAAEGPGDGTRWISPR